MTDDRKIFIDLDETLLDTFSYFVKWHDRPRPYDSIESILDLNLGMGIRPEDTLLGMSHSEAWESLPYEFWYSIPKMPWADDLIKLCEDIVGKENVYILSSQIANEGCVSGKTSAVNDYFPSYKNKLILAKNKQILVDRSSLLIDDYEGHLKSFVNAGKYRNFFLFPSITNSFYLTAQNMRGDNREGRLPISGEQCSPLNTEQVFFEIEDLCSKYLF